MDLFRRIVFVSILAGLLAGLFVTLVHQVGTVPIILKAETYEQAANDHAAEVPQAAGGYHHHDVEAWAPRDGLERTGYTALADVLTGIGFALLLVCFYALTGREVGWRQGVLWGIAGFATFTFAPSLGLPPEVPGTEAAPLMDRQVWWLATVLATGSGLALLAFTRGTLVRIAAVALLVLPHLHGAPGLADYRGLAPEALEHRFVAVAFASSLLFWAVLGALTGFFYEKIQRA